MAYQGVLNDIRACIELRRPARLPAFALGEEFDMLWHGHTNHENRTDVEKAVTGIVRAVDHFDPILLRDGTPEQVATATVAMIRENAGQAGYIFNTGEGVMANSPVANVEAMMRTARAMA